MANILCRAGIAGLLVSGCMPQSVPTVESITKPTMETFAQLGSWRPWQSAQAEKPQAAPAETPALPPPEANKPAPAEPELAKVTRPAPKPAPAVARTPKPTVPAAPRIVPAAVQAAPRVVPAAAPEETSKSLPTQVSCRTVSQPGQRVRMECDAIQ